MPDEKDYLSLPFKDFLADIAAKTPAPGGGSTAAAVGAMAASLARMVIEYTVGKERFSVHEVVLQEARRELVRAQEEFQRLLAEDIRAYRRLEAARRAGDPAVTEEALRAATAVPMENVVLAGAVAARLDELKTKVNALLYSDLQVAAILALASARAACTTARVNIAAITDRKEAQRLLDRMDLLIARAGQHRNNVLHFSPDQAA